ncbi:cytochrome b561 [Oxalobacteraceae bacterium GrIS 2.11]
MSYLNTKERYGSLSIALHWLMLLVMAAVFASIELHDSYPKGSEMRSNLMAWHFELGLTIFVLVCVRLVLKFMAPEPEIKPAISRVQYFGAKAMHLALYLVMVVMPILGYVGRCLAGRATYFFGIELPLFLNANDDLAENIFDIHGLIGNTAYFLIGFHAAAALFHHYFKKDNTLTRMLPERK